MKRLPRYQIHIETIHEKCMETINDALMYMQDRTEKLLINAIERSGLDISECRNCGKMVVCIPDGLSNWCEKCADAEGRPNLKITGPAKNR
jgi:hypothetical protein